MIKITQDNWCPRCRVMSTTWRVPGTASKSNLRPGDPWPMEDIKESVFNKCASCGKEYTGILYSHFDKPREMFFIDGIKQEFNHD